MKPWLIMLLMAVSLGAAAQIVTVSNSSRLPVKANKFKIIGKNNDGIVVRLYGTQDVINTYSDDLRLLTSKTIEFKNQTGILQHIILNKTGAVVFYLQQDKKFSVLFAQALNSKFMEIGKPVSIDTIMDRKDLVAANLRFKASADQNYLFVYYPFFEGSNIQLMKFLCVDHALQVHYNVNIPFNRNERDLEELKSLVDNEGNSLLMLKADEREGSEKYDVYRVSVKGDLATYSIGLNKNTFGEPSLEIDNKNGNLVMSAFYTDDRSEDAAHGFLYTVYNPASGDNVKSYYLPFPKQFITDLTGKETNGKGKLYTFNIRKLVLRNDGGVLVVAESLIKDSRDAGVQMITPGYTSYRSSTVYQYNDIIAFSITPDGMLDWNSIMRKKQVSEDDNGYYSGFFIMNEKEKLRLIYLDEITAGSSLNEYILKSDGKSDRAAILNQEEKDVMLLPKMAKQISPDELVVPSYKNGELRLVKISF